MTLLRSRGGAAVAASTVRAQSHESQNNKSRIVRQRRRLATLNTLCLIRARVCSPHLKQGDTGSTRGGGDKAEAAAKPSLAGAAGNASDSSTSAASSTGEAPGAAAAAAKPAAGGASGLSEALPPLGRAFGRPPLSASGRGAPLTNNTTRRASLSPLRRSSVTAHRLPCRLGGRHASVPDRAGVVCD